MPAAFKNQDLGGGGRGNHVICTYPCNNTVELQDTVFLNLIEREQAPALHHRAYTAEKFPVEARETFLLRGPKE